MSPKTHQNVRFLDEATLNAGHCPDHYCLHCRILMRSSTVQISLFGLKSREHLRCSTDVSGHDRYFRFVLRLTTTILMYIYCCDTPISVETHSCPLPECTASHLFACTQIENISPTGASAHSNILMHTFTGLRVPYVIRRLENHLARSGDKVTGSVIQLLKRGQQRRSRCRH